MPWYLRLTDFIDQPLETAGPLALHLGNFLCLLDCGLHLRLMLLVGSGVRGLVLIWTVLLIVLVVWEFKVNLIDDIVGSDLRVLQAAEWKLESLLSEIRIDDVVRGVGELLLAELLHVGAEAQQLISILPFRVLQDHMHDLVSQQANLLLHRELGETLWIDPKGMAIGRNGLEILACSWNSLCLNYIHQIQQQRREKRLLD